MRGRDEHKRDIAALVRKLGACTRPEIASKLGLNLATVSGLTRELLSGGLLAEQGHTPSEGGRRATLLAINPSYAYAIGCEVSVLAIRGRLVDLVGTPVDREDAGPFELGDRDSMLRALWEVIDALMSRADEKSLQGVGVGVSGLVDSSGGTSRAFPSP